MFTNYATSALAAGTETGCQRAADKSGALPVPASARWGPTRPSELLPECRRLDFSNVNAPSLTHYLFRFPAKFHPPVVHSLLQTYTRRGETVLDPFCGSGTLLLAAAAEGRHALGSDVDPLAVFISQIKAHRYRHAHLRSSWASLYQALCAVSRPDEEYNRRIFVDLSDDEYLHSVSTDDLWVPGIPNLLHWFRRYVIVDLSRMLRAITETPMPTTHRAFFRLIFASIIRNASNADPVPVSGLEVTSHMRKRDAEGRSINPFALFYSAAQRGLQAVESYARESDRSSRVSVFQADAKDLSRHMRRRATADAVITSPPYHNAVDYYRRHKREMFWLGLTSSQEERLALSPRYIGLQRIRNRDRKLGRIPELHPLATQWYDRMASVSSERADAFGHYMLSMQDVLGQIAVVLRAGAPAIFVVGHSRWNQHEIPTSALFAEMAEDIVQLVERLWYPVTNRYMSYGRRNGADISRDYVLVLRKRDA